MSTGAIITGVLIAFMFLVSFTQWFYQLVTGLDRVIVNDIFVVYRAITWGLVSIVFMVGFFLMLATVQECPNPEPREGLFKYLECKPYFAIREGLGFPVVMEESSN